MLLSFTYLGSFTKKINLQLVNMFALKLENHVTVKKLTYPQLYLQVHLQLQNSMH